MLTLSQPGENITGRWRWGGFLPEQFVFTQTKWLQIIWWEIMEDAEAFFPVLVNLWSMNISHEESLAWCSIQTLQITHILKMPEMLNSWSFISFIFISRCRWNSLCLCTSLLRLAVTSVSLVVWWMVCTLHPPTPHTPMALPSRGTKEGSLTCPRTLGRTVSRTGQFDLDTGVTAWCCLAWWVRGLMDVLNGVLRWILISSFRWIHMTI